MLNYPDVLSSTPTNAIDLEKHKLAFQYKLTACALTGLNTFPVIHVPPQDVTKNENNYTRICGNSFEHMCWIQAQNFKTYTRPKPDCIVYVDLSHKKTYK